MAEPLVEALSGPVRTFDLGQPLVSGMPNSPNHPAFRMALIRRHGDMVRPDGGSASNELIVTGGHVGTHIDALAHVSHDGRLFGGYSAEAAQRGGFFNVLGVETIEPLLCRGILLDVAAARRQQQLAPGYGVTREDLIETAALEKVDVQSRDVVLVRTGWASLWADPAAYLGQVSGVPGLTVEGAAWLAERGVRATGSDTTAYERIPPGVGHHLLPVHGLLLVEHGIHIIEHLNLEELSHVGVWEFLFVLVPLKLVGATGSPVRPLALVTI